MEQATKDHRRRDVYSFFNLGTRWEWVVNVTPRSIYTRERDPVNILQKGGRASGPVWTGAKNFSPTGIQYPDRLACSESLYKLSYPEPRVLFA